MATWRRKPEEVQAEQWFPGKLVPGVIDAGENRVEKHTLLVELPDDTTRFLDDVEDAGLYVLCQDGKVVTLLDPTLFHAHYEAVDEPARMAEAEYIRTTELPALQAEYKARTGHEYIVPPNK